MSCRLVFWWSCVNMCVSGRFWGSQLSVWSWGSAKPGRWFTNPRICCSKSLCHPLVHSAKCSLLYSSHAVLRFLFCSSRPSHCHLRALLKSSFTANVCESCLSVLSVCTLSDEAWRQNWTVTSKLLFISNGFTLRKNYTGLHKFVFPLIDIFLLHITWLPHFIISFFLW